MTAQKLITCLRCQQRREPVVKHGLWCKECWAVIDAKSREETATVSSIFSRRDGVVD